jgi:hypothetical protein
MFLFQKDKEEKSQILPSATEDLNRTRGGGGVNESMAIRGGQRAGLQSAPNEGKSASKSTAAATSKDGKSQLNSQNGKKEEDKKAIKEEVRNILIDT